MRRRLGPSLAAATAAVLAVVAPLSLTGPGAQAAASPAPVSSYLAHQLTSLTGATTVLVHGTSLSSAASAVSASGLREVTRFRAIGVVAARGTSAQIQSLRSRSGVTYVEAGEQPIRFFAETSNVATRGVQATKTLHGADGSLLTGKGVSVGVIDSGVDPTHPYFRESDGSSAVVANLKTLCDPTETQCTVQRVPNSLDTDTTSLGGHGTHVNGIVAGRPTKVNGAVQQGAAPGAKLVDISTGAALVIIGADAALNWVLENHNAPCGAGVSKTVCPPIKVTNNSYGPTGGGAFDPNSATVKLQRALAKQGVVTVWANGNDGGDGSADLSNPPGKDPTGGVISVASYYDLDTGTRAGKVSEFSSRGKKGDRATYPDISAPGENITSSCRPFLPICSSGLDPQNGPGPTDIATFNTISGTSMAAPHIAGIVAQLFQARPTATPAQIESALKSTAYKFKDGAPYEKTSLGSTSFDKGYGLVDVIAAARKLGAR